MKLKTYLPGEVILQRGAKHDYHALSKFHYLPKHPRTFAQIYKITHHLGETQKLIAVAVLSWPTKNNPTRHRVLKLRHKTLGQRLRFINKNLRTISRVIVHPQYRALGLASHLVRVMCRRCPTRYVEAVARMGRAHPFFEKAGMRRVDPLDPAEPVYFIFDRGR